VIFVRFVPSVVESQDVLRGSSANSAASARPDFHDGASIGAAAEKSLNLVLTDRGTLLGCAPAFLKRSSRNSQLGPVSDAGSGRGFSLFFGAGLAKSRNLFFA
jgi:hypothetical protein